MKIRRIYLQRLSLRYFAHGNWIWGQHMIHVHEAKAYATTLCIKLKEYPTATMLYLSEKTYHACMHECIYRKDVVASISKLEESTWTIMLVTMARSLGLQAEVGQTKDKQRA